MKDYTYNAEVVRWIDGDTVDLKVDLGFTVWVNQRFRLEGIDTPERGQPNYIAARDRANVIAPPGTKCIVQSRKTDKYGRYLGVIYSANVNVNETLLQEGLANVY